MKRTSLFYLIIISSLMIGTISCTIGGEVIVSPSDNIDIERYGSLLMTTSAAETAGYSVAGRVQIMKSNINENYYLEFNEDFSLMNSSMASFSAEIFLSASETAITAPMTNLGSLSSKSGHQSYQIANANDIDTASHVLIVVGSDIIAYSELMNLDDISTDGTLIYKGTFVNYAYSVSGDMELRLDSNGIYSLELLSNFSMNSAPGVFLYLTKDAGSVSPTANDVEITTTKLTSYTGPQSFPIPEGTNVFLYGYVLVHCKPFNFPLGKAELEEP